MSISVTTTIETTTQPSSGPEGSQQPQLRGVSSSITSPMPPLTTTDDDDDDYDYDDYDDNDEENDHLPTQILTTVNYFRPTSAPPPDATNSPTLSTHEIRIQRRGDDSPNINPTPVVIRNIRGREHEFSLETHGFQICRLDSALQHQLAPSSSASASASASTSTSTSSSSPSTHVASNNYRDPTLLRNVYFPEISALLKRVTGAKHVFQYEHHVRTKTLDQALTLDSEGEVDINGPVRRVHIDESPAAARKEFQYHYSRLPDSEKPDRENDSDMLERPCGIYNVWKPIRKVRRDPLCLCDVRSVNDEDLVSGKVTVPHMGEIENFLLRDPGEVDSSDSSDPSDPSSGSPLPGPDGPDGDGADADPTAEGGEREGGRRNRRKHDFWWVKGQEVHEALVFRIFDSRVDDVDGSSKRSLGVPHTSFVEPGTEGVEARESVEVRSFCVF